MDRVSHQMLRLRTEELGRQNRLKNMTGQQAILTKMTADNITESSAHYLHQGADRSRVRDCREDRLDKYDQDRDRTDMWRDHQDRDRNSSADHRGH